MLAYRVEAGPFKRIYDPSPSPREAWYINDHTIYRGPDGRWHLVGITHAEPAAPLAEKTLAHATAADLAGPWTSHRPALLADHDAGETHLWAPHVIRHDGRFWMFYCAGGESHAAYRLHLAMSDDGERWERHVANPLIVDGYDARDPMVLRVGGRWLMYYTATLEPAGGSHVVVAAESDDLVHWHGRHVVYQDSTVGRSGGPTESPFVVELDGWYYLFIGPWPGYRGTRVIASRDPLRFTLDQVVGQIDAHALEVVIDESGRTWCTHCGWGQGGVHLAPLRWESPG